MHLPMPANVLVCSRRARDRAPPRAHPTLTMAFVLGAALGPRSTRVEVRDARTGHLHATGVARHGERGRSSDDPARWWRSLVTAVGQTGEREIAAISVSGGHPGLVVLDGAGAVLRPPEPWPDAPTDTAATRLGWLRRTDPAVFDRLGMALLPHDWLTHRLTGRAVTDRGSASLTAAWSPTSEDWRGDVLRDLAPRGARDWWRDRLPTVLGPSERADWLDAPIYDLLGLRGRPIVGPGTGQDMACALALGLRPGRVGVAIAEVTTALAPMGEPASGRGRAVQSRADATGRHLAVAPAGDGMDLIDTLCALLEIGARELDDLAATADLPGDLVVVPEAASGAGTVVAGLTSAATRQDLAAAAIDGIACAALDRLDSALAVGGTWDDEEPLRLGAPREHVGLLAQVLADLSARPVRHTAESSLAAAGACLQAAAVLVGGAPDDIAETWHLGSDSWVGPRDDVNRAARREAHAEARARLQTRSPTVD